MVEKFEFITFVAPLCRSEQKTQAQWNGFNAIPRAPNFQRISLFIDTDQHLITHHHLLFPLQTLQMYAEFHCILCLLVNDFQGQWKKGVLGVQLQNLLADTDTQLLTFNGSPAAQILHGFYKSKISLIFYLTWFSLEKIRIFGTLDKQKSHSKFKSDDLKSVVSGNVAKNLFSVHKKYNFFILVHSRQVNILVMKGALKLKYLKNQTLKTI